MISYIKRTLLNILTNRFGIPQTAIAYIKPMAVAGQQTRIGLPRDLISLNVLNLMRGVYNRIVFSQYSNWVWPYWVVRQYDYRGLSFIPRGFQIPSINVGHRNWTAIGNLKHEKEAILDPRGLLTPIIDSWSIDIFAVYEGKLYAPSQLRQVKQRVLHSIPMIETSFEVGDFGILITSFAQLIQDRDVIFHHVNVTNHGHHSDDITLYLSIRPYNPEGISLINKIHFQHDAFYVNGSLGVVLMEKPQQVLCSNLKGGDVTIHLTKPDLPSTYECSCNAGLCTASASYSFMLNPGEEKSLEFRVPMDKKMTLSRHTLTEGPFDHYRQNMLASWRRKLQESIQVSLPDKKLEKALRTNISYLLLFFDGNSITPGPFNYHHFWFRDAAYLLQALCKSGFIEETKQVLLTYPSRQKLNGFYYSQQSEWDSNGQAIWIIAEYYRITGDKDLIRKLIPSVSLGAKWIIRKLAHSNNKKTPYRGIMPIGLSAEHFGANDYYYWDDYWALQGLLDAKFLIEELPDEHISTRAIDHAIIKLRENIEASLSFANNKFDKPYLPISPDRYMDSAAIGSLVTIYPLKLLDINDKRLANTVEFLRDNCFTNNVFFHDINHSGHGTYLNMHIVQYYLQLRNPRALDILQWMTNISSHTFTWPESIHPFTFGGVVGDGHHGWAAADYFMAVRNMLFMEQDDTLVLTPVIPLDWISLYETIEVKNAPSHFGQVTFRYEVKQKNELEIQIHNEYTHSPKSIEINLPVYIESIQIDNFVQDVHDRKFLTSPSTTHIRVFFSDRAPEAILQEASA